MESSPADPKEVISPIHQQHQQQPGEEKPLGLSLSSHINAQPAAVELIVPESLRQVQEKLLQDLEKVQEKSQQTKTLLSSAAKKN